MIEGNGMTMEPTLFFKITLEKPVKGFKSPLVLADQHNGLAGFWCHGKLYIPDLEGVRSYLPYRYQKAFDRIRGQFWYPAYGSSLTATCFLSDRRNNSLNTIFAALIEPKPITLPSGETQWVFQPVKACCL